MAFTDATVLAAITAVAAMATMPVDGQVVHQRFVDRIDAM